MKVLIAIDGSACSDAAFESVSNRQWSTGDQFRVITVVEPIIGYYPGIMTYVETMADVQQELRQNGREFLKKRMDALQAKFPENAVTGQLIEGLAAESIIGEIKAWQADLIILGSHGRKGFSKFLLGSVAETVASQASCSIEIVKAQVATVDRKHPTVQTSQMKRKVKSGIALQEKTRSKV